MTRPEEGAGMAALSGQPGRQGQGPVTKERGLEPAGGSGGSLPRASTCYGDVCITCSDTAVEVTVLRLLADALAVVDTGQGEEEVSVALVEAKPGDTILVHAKEAIAIVGR
jgi:hydrogenase expression/formation protein HypC